MVNKTTLNFLTWIGKGITQLHHVIQDKILASFPYLVQKHGIESKHFLEYQEIKSTIQAKIYIQTANLDITPPILKVINIPFPQKKLSKIHKIILQSEKTLSPPYHK